MLKIAALAITLGIFTLVSTIASAAPKADRGPTPGLGWGAGGKGATIGLNLKPGGPRGGKTVGVPGPIAGVGLPILAVAGGLMWVAKRRRRNNQP